MGYSLVPRPFQASILWLQNPRHKTWGSLGTRLANACLTCTYNLTSFLLRHYQLIGGLADEKVRWAESVANFDSMLVNVVGDVMVSAGAVAYLGPFTVSALPARGNAWTLNYCSFYSVPYFPLH